MPHTYSEDQLVEQPAIGLFADLGWATVSALEETFGAISTLLREASGEVVLVSRLRAPLERLNPALPPEAITATVDELTRDRLAMSYASNCGRKVTSRPAPRRTRLNPQSKWVGRVFLLFKNSGSHSRQRTAPTSM